MAKLTLKQLKQMIREAVRDQIEEQLSGGINVGGGRGRGYMGGLPGGGQPRGSGSEVQVKQPAATKPLDIAKFSLGELMAMLENPNLAPESKKQIVDQVGALMKKAG